MTKGEIPTAPSLILAGALGIISPPISYFLANSEGTLPWLIDLATHFQGLYVLLLLVGLVISLRKSRRYIWVVALLPLPWLTALESAPKSSSIQPGIKILSANIHFKNNDLSTLKNLITSEHPDIVVLLELSHVQAGQLVDLKDYIFQQIQPDNSPFGIGVISRLPFSSVTTDWNWKGTSLKIPTIEVITKWKNQPIKLVAFHPMPPLAPEYHTVRNSKLKEIVEDSKQQRLPTIIAGDFNATPWSSAFAGIDYYRATGLQSTWPFRHLGIAVDQILVSDHWKVKRSWVGPDIGSDHLPVIAEVHMQMNEKMP